MVWTSLESTVVPGLRNNEEDGWTSVYSSCVEGFLQMEKNIIPPWSWSTSFVFLHGLRKLYMSVIVDLRTHAAPNHTRSSSSTDIWYVPLISVAIVCKNLAHCIEDHLVCWGLLSLILTPGTDEFYTVGAISQEHISTSYPGVKHVDTVL